MAEFQPGNEYASFDGDATGKIVTKPWQKRITIFSIAAAFLYIGMMVHSIWEPQQTQANLQAQATSVAEEMEKLISQPEHIADVKRLAEKLEAAALDLKVDSAFPTQVLRFAKQVRELMADPELMEKAARVGEEMNAVLGAPIVQEETVRLLEQMDTLVANLPEALPSEQDESSPGRRLSGALPLLRSSQITSSRPKASFAVPQTFGKAMRDVSMAAARTKPKARAPPPARAPKETFPLLGALGEIQLPTLLASLQVLTSAEKAGVFTKLEKAKAFSTAEKLAPLVDQLGLLQFLQDAVDSKSSSLTTTGAALLVLGPIYVALVSEGFLPTPEGPVVLAPGLVFTTTTAAGVFYLILGQLIGELRKGRD